MRNSSRLHRLGNYEYPVKTGRRGWKKLHALPRPEHITPRARTRDTEDALVLLLLGEKLPERPLLRLSREAQAKVLDKVERFLDWREARGELCF